MYFSNNIGLLLLLGLTIGLANAIDDKSPSPVLFWSSEPLLNRLPETESVDSIQTKAFHDGYLTPLIKDFKHSIVAFLQDKLCIDDFTKYADVYAPNSAGGAFKNIKQMMDDNFSLELPQVINPHVALDSLKESFPGNIHTVSSVGELESLSFPSGEKFLLIVKLNSLADAVDEEKAIGQNDQIIGDLTKSLAKRDIKYTALFTGKTGGSDASDNQADIQVHTGRHLLADEGNATGIFMNVTDANLFVYLRKAVVCIKSGGNKCSVLLDMVPKTDTADSSKKNNNTVGLVLDFKDQTPSGGSEAYKVSIASDLRFDKSKWVIGNTTLSVSGHNVSFSNAPLVADGVDFVVPVLFSFHCSNLRMQVETLKNVNMSQYKGSYILLDGYQVQSFNISNDRFSNAQDCVGFFTTAIWMGIIPSILLLVILLSGTMMLLNLSVTDRFDDPKKKTISIAVTD